MQIKRYNEFLKKQTLDNVQKAKVIKVKNNNCGNLKNFQFAAILNTQDACITDI